MNTMRILKWLVTKLFHLLGWQVVGDMPPHLHKAVLIFAPHTSNWDAFYSLATVFIRKHQIRFAIKKEALFFPLGKLLKALGAIPIDRNKQRCPQGQRTSTVDTFVQLFAENDQLILAISPEGTRKYAQRWRNGFYHTAMQANVPIVLGYLDYAKKQTGFGPVFYPTGNMQQDIQQIQAFYKDKMGKYPEQGVR